MNLTSWFASLFAGVAAEVAKVSAEVVALGAKLVSTGVADVEQVFALGAPIAVQAVLAEAPKVISGQEKFSNAVTNVMQKLEAKLGPVAIGDVRTLVQIAYQGMQQIASNG